MNLQTGDKEARLLHPSEMPGADAAQTPMPREEKVTTTVIDKEGLPLAVSEEPGQGECVNEGECTAQKDPDGAEGGGSHGLLAPPPENFAQTRDDDAKQEAIQRAIELKKAEFWAKKYQEVFHPEEDAKIIRQILQNIRSWMDNGWNSTDLQSISTQVLDLEDYCHQIDNAVDMVNMGGLKILSDLVSRPLEREYLRIQSYGVWAIGTSAQNNEKVKEAALSSNVLEIIVRQLRANLTAVSEEAPVSSSRVQDDDDGDGDIESTASLASFRKKAFYAISALIDSNQEAQKQFWDLGGPSTVLAAWSESLGDDQGSLGDSKENRGVVRKAVGLTLRTLSGINSDPSMFLHALVRVWLGSHGLCTLVVETLSLGSQASSTSTADERLFEDSLRLLSALLSPDFTREEPQSPCISELSKVTPEGRGSHRLMRALESLSTAFDATQDAEESELDDYRSPIPQLVATVRERFDAALQNRDSYL